MAASGSDAAILTPPAGGCRADEVGGARRSAFPIVGIGASAGGAQALAGLLSAVPADAGMAFIAIRPPHPDREDPLPALLAEGCRMTVELAADGAEVRPDRVYVIAPDVGVGIAHGRLRISPPSRAPGPHHPIDDFLRSLAADRPGSAIGVVLSGEGEDGMLGLAAIKAARGVTFAQDHASGRPGLPQGAIARYVDFVLPAAGIALELGKIAQFGFPRLPPPAEPPSSRPPGLETTGGDPPAEDARRLQVVVGLLYATTGIDFTRHRPAVLARHAMRRMARLSHGLLAEYVGHLVDHPDEVDALARDILVDATIFHRDQAFRSLASVAFPALVQGRAADAAIRLWVVGCSTGQEVYALGIELLEYLAGAAPDQRVQIFATDISDWARAQARLGRFPDSIADEIPPELLARHFTREADGFRVGKALRDRCVFAKHDITADTPFSHIDLVCCRNVLVYLGPALRERVLPMLHFALEPGGFLLLGAADTIAPASDLYATVDEENRLYRPLLPAGRARPMAGPPRRADAPGLPIPPRPVAPSRSEAQRAADQIVLDRFAPAGVLVSESMEIIQFRGRTAPYLEPAQGGATLDLLAMVPFGVADALRAALAEARLGDLPVRRERVAHLRGGSFREIAIEVIPVRPRTGGSCFLVLFDGHGRQEPPGPDQAVAPTPSAPVQPDLAQLRGELAAATDRVRALAEQGRVQAERLVEVQDEAQAGAEEFRSVNEELQTAKEEVEAANEALRGTNEQLRASGELAAVIIETMRYPLLVLDAGLAIESVNQAFLEAFGCARHEAIGRQVYGLGDGRWDIPELHRLLDVVLRGRPAVDDLELVHDFGPGAPSAVLIHARRLRDGDGEPGRTVLVVADISERTRASRILQEASAEQLRSNAELENFAAVTSHDLQQPLRMMSSFLGLLQSHCGPLFDDRARQYIAHVTDAARRMSEMIDASLAYSRLGHEEPAMAVFDSALAVEDALVDLQPAIAEAQATVVVQPLPTVLGNRGQLARLFQNLLSNALKFRDPLRPLEIRVSATQAPRDWIFAIADNGAGMAESDHSRIFDLFQRAHLEDHVQGCGIGLATCKKIVEHHRGRIWVESTPGVGSTFSVAIPT